MSCRRLRLMMRAREGRRAQSMLPRDAEEEYAPAYTLSRLQLLYLFLKSIDLGLLLLDRFDEWGDELVVVDGFHAIGRGVHCCRHHPLCFLRGDAGTGRAVFLPFEGDAAEFRDDFHAADRLDIIFQSRIRTMEESCGRDVGLDHRAAIDSESEYREAAAFYLIIVADIDRRVDVAVWRGRQRACPREDCERAEDDEGKYCGERMCDVGTHMQMDKNNY